MQETMELGLAGAIEVGVPQEDSLFICSDDIVEKAIVMSGEHFTHLNIHCFK